MVFAQEPGNNLTSSARIPRSNFSLLKPFKATRESLYMKKPLSMTLASISMGDPVRYSYVFADAIRTKTHADSITITTCNKDHVSISISQTSKNSTAVEIVARFNFQKNDEYELKVCQDCSLSDANYPRTKLPFIDLVELSRS